MAKVHRLSKTKKINVVCAEVFRFTSYLAKFKVVLNSLSNISNVEVCWLDKKNPTPPPVLKLQLIPENNIFLELDQIQGFMPGPRDWPDERLIYPEAKHASGICLKCDTRLYIVPLSLPRSGSLPVGLSDR